MQVDLFRQRAGGRLIISSLTKPQLLAMGRKNSETITSTSRGKRGRGAGYKGGSRGTFRGKLNRERDLDDWKPDSIIDSAEGGSNLATDGTFRHWSLRENLDINVYNHR